MLDCEGEHRLYRCGCAHARPTSAAANGLRIAGGIDLHCHIIVPEVDGALAGRPELEQITAIAFEQNGHTSQDYNGRMVVELLPKLTDVEERLADMDRLGIETQVLSPSPTQYHYWADASTAAYIVELQNRRLEEICAVRPDRFLALGAVAMQHPELAVEQLDNLMARGFKGVEISTRIDGRDLSDAAFEPFWRSAAAREAVIFIHPLGSSLGGRIAPFYLSNVIGQPIETTIALSCLIFSGVFDRHPRLKICAAHGGGYLPGYIGRSNHAHQVRPEAATCRRRPSEYLRGIWFDTVVHDPAVLGHLIEAVGASQVVLGTDYPFDMGEYRVAELLASIPNLDEAGRDAIVSGNARRLLGI